MQPTLVTWALILLGVVTLMPLIWAQLAMLIRPDSKEYVYPTRGPLKYYTYYWGFFVYWGALALAYSILRISGVHI